MRREPVTTRHGGCSGCLWARMRARFGRRRPKTPAQAITEVLRGLGLRPGFGADFTVSTVYHQVGFPGGDAERLEVTLRTPRARARVAAQRETIERHSARAGFPFFVRSRKGVVYLANELTRMLPRDHC